MRLVHINIYPPIRRNGCVYRDQYMDIFWVGKIYYSATCSLNFSLFLKCSCYVPMGARVPGPLSNGLYITQACITHMECSKGKKIWGMVYKQGITLIAPGTVHHGSGSCTRRVSMARRSSWCQTGMSVLLGLRCVSLSQSCCSEVLRTLTSYRRVWGAHACRITAHLPSVFKLEKTFFQN